MNLKEQGARPSKSFAFGLLFGLVLAGCAGFQYKYYALDAASYEGALRGPEPKDDLPLTECQPDARVRGKCVVMLVDEFRAFRIDYDRIKTQLNECQSSQ